MDVQRDDRRLPRRAAGRILWSIVWPVHRYGQGLRSLRRRTTRRWFLVRVRAAALVVRARVDLEIAPDVDIARAVRIEVWPATQTRLRIESGVSIRQGALLSLRGGTLEIGADTQVRRMVTLQIGGTLAVGRGVVLSTGLVIHCAESVRVDDLTIIGEFTTITDSAHLRTPPGEPVHHSVRVKPTRVGSNVWIGAHAIIASGVVVGDQAFIGGSAVVVRDAPAGWLTAGNPAKPIRELTEVSPSPGT